MKMGAKRVSDTIRLENLLLKGREPGRASPWQHRIDLAHLASFFLWENDLWEDFDWVFSP